jgi:hypothetical protein
VTTPSLHDRNPGPLCERGQTRGALPVAALADIRAVSSVGDSGGSPRPSTLPRIPFASLRYVRKLGAGAFGEVEERLWFDTPVAVKANGMGPGDAAALEAEVLLYTQLRDRPHPNIVQVVGVCVDAPDGKTRVVMRLCPKGSLEDLLAKARLEVCSEPLSPGPTLAAVVIDGFYSIHAGGSILPWAGWNAARFGAWHNASSGGCSGPLAPTRNPAPRLAGGKHPCRES